MKIVKRMQTKFNRKLLLYTVLEKYGI